MSQEQFEDLLRQFLRRQPFRPFEVELLDGQVIYIDGPVAFNGGAAMYFTADLDIVSFACENVKAVRDATRATAS